MRKVRDAEPPFDRAVWREIVELGWASILVDEEQGGMGLGLRHVMAVMEEVGRFPVLEPVLPTAVHAVTLLMEQPSGGLRDELLRRVQTGSCVIGVAWQEQASELDPSTLDTVARREGDGFVLHGDKHWVAPGSGADGWLVLATDGTQPQLFWVSADTSGIACTPTKRVDGSSMCSLHLANARVASHNLLGSGAAVLASLSRAHDITRFAQAGELLGIARRSFDLTLDYLKTRVQFGKPIGANQALQHRMVDAWLQVELASACVQSTLDDHEAGRGSLSALASRAKARCAHAAVMVTRLSVQFHGAMGFTDECDIGLYWKRALHLASWLGGAGAHRDRHLRAQTADRELVGHVQDHAACDIPAAGALMTSMDMPAFRRAVRAFLQANYPQHHRHAPRRLHWGEIKDWYFALSRQGWIAPAWPREHGGMALSPDRLIAFIEEFEDFGAGRLPDQGLINLGPVLIRYGNAEQQRQYLPKILSGEHVWCQGYSEPNAGSDLASLRTEAVLDGDHFVVNGQKIWTTLAQDATHIFLLVRTDKTVKKQAGISFLLADLATPGIKVRPIRNIAGEEEFCEVFFDDVRVPQENLVGDINKGWDIAKALLGHERLFVGSPKTSQHALGLLRRLAEKRALFADAAFASRFAALDLDLADLRAAYAGFAEIVKRGGELPPSVSLLKIWATETYTRICAELVATAAEDGATLSAPGGVLDPSDPIAPLFTATITTIYGGSNEIQRNILARTVLQLPS